MKNKFIKLSVVGAASIILTSSIPFTTVSASVLENNSVTENLLADEDKEYVNTYPLYLENDEVLNFFSEKDRADYVNSQNQVNTRSGIKSRETEISRKTYYNTFIGYNSLTPNWSYANSYTISKNKNVSFTTVYSYDGVSTSLTVSQTYGVSIALPADRKKASRLAASADVTVAKCKVEFYYGNTVTNTTYVLRTRSHKNITNYVKYR